VGGIKDISRDRRPENKQLSSSKAAHPRSRFCFLFFSKGEAGEHDRVVVNYSFHRIPGRIDYFPELRGRSVGRFIDTRI
jgi:hypothetical protein